MEYSNEVVAKIPCPNAGVPSLTTASDVATLEFLRTHTSTQRVTLADSWDTMSTLERYKVTDRVVEMEKELYTVQFPAYGSLYRDSVPHDCHYHPLPPNLDPTGLFYIGPSCSRTVWHRNSKDISEPDVGPCLIFASFGYFQLLTHMKRPLSGSLFYPAQDQQPNHFSQSQSAEEYKYLLEKVIQVLLILSQDSHVLEGTSPVIGHTNLHLGNIYVSREDPTLIEGIIDWQSTQVAPLLIQARFPGFLRPPKTYESGTEVPSLSTSFDELGPSEKAKITSENELASRSKYYEMSCLAYNKRVYNAMELDRRLWGPFTCCQLFFKWQLGSTTKLSGSHFQDWNVFDLPENCTQEELQGYDEQVVQYQDRLYLWDIAKTQLCTADSGWVPMFIISPSLPAQSTLVSRACLLLAALFLGHSCSPELLRASREGSSATSPLVVRFFLTVYLTIHIIIAWLILDFLSHINLALILRIEGSRTLGYS
ncbi:conserved hypothetical protein [Talaromyces stipitatus ATCC 10500]|uniref:Aminoglycoside phosphotransferase domain-containing protein n=1 Tax=Talaromyces stipitatus (strain ATCC 10500 / CBS 375.48 / QM 6759 / NRRL 1006) TaxID=441959 RepID=B8MTV5_TALSN|nr:uncharacterized protein TSTA_005350 [Talaromyces stipitatus ATCC 10500]EED12498.1 conserved hypothetical protein [Talaromyces stipitatus ATCC 10500]